MRPKTIKSFTHLSTLIGGVMLLTACSGGGSSNTDDTDTVNEVDNSTLSPLASDLADDADFYKQNGYDTLDVLTVNVVTAPQEGDCNTEDRTGCTFEDINNDNDGSDDFKPKMKVHFSTSDYTDDALDFNAALKQRGDSSRQADQKSYAITLEKDLPLWRNERRLQLNKHPFDPVRIRNKISFDLMKDISHLNSLRTQFVNLKIEDQGQVQDYGLFTHIEHVTEQYLENRGYDKDSLLYKTVNFDFSSLEDRLRLNEDGTPVDEDRFERNLEIKGADDHRSLVNMLTALNDPDSDKAQIIEENFNENNIVTWLAFNILVGNVDTVFENHYIFSPKGSNRFYYLPWDYDGAFRIENSPNDYDGQNATYRRINYGISKWWQSVLISNWLQLDGSYQLLRTRVTELYNGALSEGRITALTDSYKPLIQPILMASPDAANLYGESEQEKLVEWYTEIENMPGVVTTNYESFINTAGWPMTFALNDVVTSGTTSRLSWMPSWDFENDTITYDVTIADNPGMQNPVISETVSNVVVKTPGDSAKIVAEIDNSNLATGTWYWQVIARDDSNPEENWRPSTARVTVDGANYNGVSSFIVP